MKRLLIVGLVLLFATAFAFGEGNIVFDHVVTIPAEDDGRGPLFELDFASEQSILGGPLYLMVDLVTAIKGGEDEMVQNIDLETGVGFRADSLGKVECYLETVTDRTADPVDPVYSIKVTWEKTFSW